MSVRSVCSCLVVSDSMGGVERANSQSAQDNHSSLPVLLKSMEGQGSDKCLHLCWWKVKKLCTLPRSLKSQAPHPLEMRA